MKKKNLDDYAGEISESKDELSSKLRSFGWMNIELTRSEDVAR